MKTVSMPLEEYELEKKLIASNAIFELESAFSTAVINYIVTNGKTNFPSPSGKPYPGAAVLRLNSEIDKLLSLRKSENVT